MREFENNAYFWQKVDTLFSSGDFKITNKKGSAHKHYPSLTYPCDYGYIESLKNEDNNKIEMYKSNNGNSVDAIVVCADIISKGFEIKGLCGLNDEEIEAVLRFLNCTEYQKTVLIKRGTDIPAWGETE